jgi:hypothetical protein
MKQHLSKSYRLDLLTFFTPVGKMGPGVLSSILLSILLVGFSAHAGIGCEIFYRKGAPRSDIAYKPVKWLPDELVNKGLYQYRHTVWDSTTGEQLERFRFNSNPLDWPQPINTGPANTFRVFNFQVYPPGGKTRVIMSQHYLGPADIKNPIYRHKDPFYRVPLSNNPLPLQHKFKPQYLPHDMVDRLSGSVFEKQDGLLDISINRYDDYPEVTIKGLYSKHQIGATHDKKTTDTVRLFPLDDRASRGYEGGKALRIRTHKSGNLIHEVIDVIPSVGKLSPGLFLTLKDFFPPHLHDELKTVLKKVSEDEIYGVERVLDRLMLSNGLDPKIIAMIETALRAEGKRRQQSFIQEVLDFIIPLYKDRRHWSEEKLEALKKHSFETMDMTRYIRVKNEKGDVVSMIGLTTASYGKVHFFDDNKKSYVEMIGPFGSAYMAEKTGTTLDPSQIPPPFFWNQSVDVLPVETEGFQPLPRPSVPDDNIGLTSMDMRNRLMFDTTISDLGYKMDLDKPFYFSTGRIIEPVKFGVAKNLADFGVSNVEVLAQLLMSIFPNEFSDRFNTDGQMVITYNPIEGARMYGLLGFEKYGPPILIDGKEWYSLVATPKSLLKGINRVRNMRSQEAEEILNTLAKRFLQLDRITEK